MNNKVKNSFLRRHVEGPRSSNGEKLYVEDFYINQLRPSLAEQNFLHCVAYGECFWGDKYQYRRYRDPIPSRRSVDEWWSFEHIVAGDAVFICNKIRYRACPGDVVIMRPGMPITYRAGQSGFLRKKCVLVVSPMLGYIWDNGSLAGINHIQSPDSQRITDIYNLIKDIIITQHDHCQQDIGVQAYALLSELNHLATPQQYPTPLRNALDIIDSNPHQDYTLASLSARCKVSVSTLSRLFKQYLDLSPVNYIIDRRLEQAKLLLNISNMTLKEIAEKCGYKSESFLSRSFKKKFGVSPSHFKRS